MAKSSKRQELESHYVYESKLALARKDSILYPYPIPCRGIRNWELWTPCHMASNSLYCKVLTVLDASSFGQHLTKGQILGRLWINNPVPVASYTRICIPEFEGVLNGVLFNFQIYRNLWKLRTLTIPVCNLLQFPTF